MLFPSVNIVQSEGIPTNIAYHRDEDKMEITELLQSKSGIRLDIGCGGAKQSGFVGLDARPLEGVDIVWDVCKFPWPLPDECVLTAISSHLVEHIPPFQADPKLLGLIDLLLTMGVITVEQVANFIGEYNSMPMFIRFMNEVWRVLKVGGEFAISCPHGRSDGFLQDPSHIHAINEAKWAYFDPFEPNTGVMLWNIYKPLPWRLKTIFWEPSANI
jgi:SAM-dependent methyltransferase